MVIVGGEENLSWRVMYLDWDAHGLAVVVRRSVNC